MFAVIIAAGLSFGAFAVLDHSPAADAAGGTGNPYAGTSWYSSNPGASDFHISGADELAYLTLLVNGGTDFYGKTITLIDDIDLSCYGTSNMSWNSGRGWVPIGMYDEDFGYTNYFEGTFDGGHHVITNLTINTSEDHAALFGYLGSNGTVKYLGIEGGSVIGTYDGNIGGLVGENLGTIQNCYNTSMVSSNGSNIGGLVGFNFGTIQNCYNTGTVTGGAPVGGLAGYNYRNGIIQNCYNAGTVTGGGFLGGVVGVNDLFGTVSDCYNAGDITGNSNDIGGVIGYNNGNSDNCYNTGSVTSINGAGNVGGVVGYSNGIAAVISNCYNAGSVYTTDGAFVGGVIGWNDGSTVSNCYNIGSVSNSVYKNYVGGVVGRNNGEVSDCYNTGDVNNTGDNSYAGGVAGYSDGTVQYCYNTGTVTGDDKWKAGGLVGYSDGMVQYCYNTGDIASGGYCNVGGLVGYNNGTVQYCYNTGMVTVDYNCDAGGVVGENFGTVQYCYNTGDITGGNYCYAGGVVGYSEYTIQYCYNTGIVTSNGNFTGGVAGGNLYGTVQYCYNTGSVIGDGDAGGVAGVSFFGSVMNCYNTGDITGSSGNNVGGVVGENYGELRNCYSIGHIAVSGDDRRVGGVAGYSSRTVSDCYYNTDKYSGYEIGMGTGSGDATGGLTTAQMIDPWVLDTGYMNMLGPAFEKRDADADFCYYPELAVFSGMTDTGIPAEVQDASKASAALEKILPDLYAATTPINEGQTLNDSILDVTAKDPESHDTIGGTFAWDDGSIKPKVSGSDITGYNYTFTPSLEIYKVAHGTTTVTVIKNTAPPAKGYSITATSDQNSSITPEGIVAVKSGGSQTFEFSASSGHLVSSVIVDGKALTKSQISLGQYTFTNVVADHKIDVSSSIDPEAGVNPDDPAYSGGSGSDPGSGHGMLPLILGLIFLLIIIGLLLWFLIIRRRQYNVTKVSGGNVDIIGKDKAHRKSEYRFSLNGEFSGTVSYRVGENGQRTILQQNPKGEYTIPGKDVTGHITIELR